MKRYFFQIMTCLLSLLLLLTPICSRAEDDTLYFENFENGSMEGWVSYEEKSGIVETEEGRAYCVRSYDYNSKTTSFSDYVFTFRMKIDYKGGASAPAFYLRRGANGSRYEAYIDSVSGKMLVDRVINEEKSCIGEMQADFEADNVQWVSVKFVLSGKNIWIYYKDMETPKAKLRDESALMVGGIGFGFGNADFMIDDLVISELAEPLPEPYEISPEEKKDYRDSEFYEEIDQLIAFGIINAYDDGSFRPNHSVTRAEFAALVVRARNIQNSATVGETFFSDVPSDNWASPYVATVCAMGYMMGNGENCFLPNDPITLEQASKVLVRLLGAEVFAERYGGYPNGYFTYAEQRGVLKGIKKKRDEALTRAEVAKLIANTVKLDMMKQTGFGILEEYSEERGVTLLSQYRKIFPYKGRITANYFAGIYSDEELGKDEVLIDGMKVKAGTTNAQRFLGYYVTSYVRYSDDMVIPELVWIQIDEKKSNVLKIAAEDIVDVPDLEKIIYREKDTGRILHEPLSKNTNLILNDASGSFTEENMKPKNGNLTLFDVDADGVYETVLSENYKTLVAGNISVQQQKIYDKYDSASVLNLNDKSAEVEIYRGYQKISFLDILPLDVLSIAETEKRALHKKIKVYVSEKRIQGKIVEYELDGDSDFVIVKGKSYEVSEYWKTNVTEGRMNSFQTGVTATLLLDSFGKVVSAEFSPSSDFMLLNAVMWERGADSGWIAELFTSKGEWQTIKFASDIYYNGKQQKLSEKDFPADLYSRQIVKVKFNSKGQISSVDTASGSKELVKKRVYDDWPMEYISQTKSFDTDSYVDEQTLVFVVPYHTEEREDYIASDYTYFKSGSTYRLWSYNEDQYEVADIVLVFEKEDSGGNGKYARPFFFHKMTKATDGEGNVIRKINGYRGGEEISFSLAEGTKAEFVCGDALTLSQNSKGEVVDCKYLYRVSDGEKGSDNSNFGMSGDRITVSGKVMDYDPVSGRILLDVGNAQKKEKAFIVNGAYQVYCCERERKRIIKTTIDEICIGDFIMMDFSWNELRDIMIYRS